MTTTLPPHDRAPALSALDIPAQRQASPVRVPAPAAPRARRRWPVAVGGLAAGLAVGTAGAIGAVEATTTHAAPVPVGSRVVVADVSVPGRVQTTFGDGTWQVGVDVEPGTYASAGGTDCHHALRSTRSGADGDGGGGTTVVLGAQDGWFATSGCATWHRAG
jgi:hypothetical protein